MTSNPFTGTVTVSRLLDDLTQRFSARGIAEPVVEAREIVSR